LLPLKYDLDIHFHIQQESRDLSGGTGGGTICVIKHGLYGEAPKWKIMGNSWDITSNYRGLMGKITEANGVIFQPCSTRLGIKLPNLVMTFTGLAMVKPWP
jgi:hypothetical protein